MLFVILIGRTKEKLEQTALKAAGDASEKKIVAVDLTIDKSISLIKSKIETEFGKVDIFINSAGIYSSGSMEEASLSDLDNLYNANVRAPYNLIQSLLPMMRTAKAQIVFINSTQALNAGKNISQFALTQHAVKAIADSLREEVNADGMRVTSLFLGRTATPRMVALYQKDAKAYNSSVLLQPEDVATTVCQILALPATAEVTNIHMRPAIKSY